MDHFRCLAGYLKEKKEEKEPTQFLCQCCYETP